VIKKGKLKKAHYPRWVKYVSSVSFNREIKKVLEKIGITRSLNFSKGLKTIK
jgi:DNA-directed RNA polymerase subunit N (RpoN/RPB10)